jgi:hypothetical protein
LVSEENNVTIDAGLIDEPVVAPLLGSIGNLVFEDLNANGVRDAGDPGEPGVTIELLDGSGNPVLDGAGNPITTVTNASGIYEFNDLPAGDYRIRSSLPGGHFFTQQNAGGNSTIDSDVDSLGVSSVVTLSAGENNQTVDVGLAHFASLGDTVFFDGDGDGVQGAGETGVANVVVNLLNGSGNPVLDSSGNPITTTTDASGHYLFEELQPGDFQVEFVAPVGMDITLADAGGDDSADSDADPTTGLSPVVALVSEENNVTIDAGLIDEPVDPPVDPPTVDPPVVDPPVVDPPIVDPPPIDPPVVDPPIIDPPIVDPPTIDPPVVDPPSVDPPPTIVPPIVDSARTSGSPANLPAPFLLPVGSQGLISNFIGGPNQNFNSFSIVSNANPLTLQSSRAVTGGYSSGSAIAGEYWAEADQGNFDQGWVNEGQGYVDQSWVAEGQFPQQPSNYDVEESIYGDMSYVGVTDSSTVTVDGSDAWTEVVGQEAVEVVMPLGSATIAPIENCNFRVPFLKRIHNWLHR